MWILSAFGPDGWWREIAWTIDGVRHYLVNGTGRCQLLLVTPTGRRLRLGRDRAGRLYRHGW